MLNDIKIGFTSTTFRRIKNLESIVRIAKESGVDCIEWGGDVHVTDISTAQRAKELCQKYGVEACSYASYYRVGSGDKAEFNRLCQIATALTAKSIRVWLGTKSSMNTDATYYDKILEDIKSICKVADDYGLSIMPECHRNTYNDDTDCFLKIAQEADCKNLKTYFQSVYKDLSYDFDRIERTIQYIDKIHISFSERAREQIFISKDKDYVSKLLHKVLNLNFRGTILLEYVRFGSVAFYKRDIARLKNILEITKDKVEEQN